MSLSRERRKAVADSSSERKLLSSERKQLRKQ
jgi:hypothetical protein